MMVILSDIILPIGAMLIFRGYMFYWMPVKSGIKHEGMLGPLSMKLCPLVDVGYSLD